MILFHLEFEPFHTVVFPVEASQTTVALVVEEIVSLRYMLAYPVHY